MIAVSIVSHGHGEMVKTLVAQLIELPQVSQVILTINIPEQLDFEPSDKITIVSNVTPKGFGSNHNAAFKFCNTEFFCVLNPDISFESNPFAKLVQDLDGYSADAVAPLVVNKEGGIEDSVRYFPTIPALFRKLLFGYQNRYSVIANSKTFSPEWVAGMFMLFTSSAYQKLSGFDERYFLYYEDVDICVRLWRSGFRLVADPAVTVVHDAQRASRRNFHHMTLHLSSMSRYLITQSWRLPKIQLSDK